MSKVSPPIAAGQGTRTLRFGAYSVGSDLRHAGVPVDITPKAFAVLRLLVEHAGALVTKEALWAAVWPRVVVTDAALTVCVAELRRVLGDDVRAPRFIVTVPKRGYRFVHPLHEASGAGTDVVPASLAELVGREHELAALRAALAESRGGQRRLVFVTGEPGIGKTALLEAFCCELQAIHGIRPLLGHCSEQFGAVEPYLPLLGALGQACRAQGGDLLVRSLARHAPGWLAQLPGVAATVQDPGPVGTDASPERLLRELADAVEILAQDRPLVWCLEDLHWSDRATLDWLAYVARRPRAARLLVVATLRDDGALRSGHPLRELLAALGVHAHCRTVAVSRFAADAVRGLLEQRLGHGVVETSGAERLDQVARVLHTRTDGVPLHVVGLVDEARAGSASLGDVVDALTRPTVPASLQQFIGLQVDQLAPTEQALLEAASVCGESVVPGLVAVALGVDDDEAEARCDALARDTRLLLPAGSTRWPDGTVASRFGFKHSLYRELLYSRVPAGRLARLHRLCGERLERAYRDRTDEVAAELAAHFARGHVPAAAARYHLVAGRSALGRAAYADAEAQLRAGLAQVAAAGEDLRDCELALQAALGRTLIALRGWASSGAEQAFARAYHLGFSGGADARFIALWGMSVGAVVRADFARYAHLARELAALATETAQPLHVGCAHWAAGQSQFHAGELGAALDHLEQARRHFHALPSAVLIDALGTDFGVFTACYLAHTRWLLGGGATALAIIDEAVNGALAGRHPFSTVLAHAYRGLLHALDDAPALAARDADTVIELSTEHGFEYYRGWGVFLRGWAASPVAEGEQGMQSGLTAMQSGGARLRRAYYLALLAERRALAGDLAAADQALDAARAEFAATHERCWQAELERIGGVLAERHGDDALAEQGYRAALDRARQQQALGLVWRAARPFARLLERMGRIDEARAVLGESSNAAPVFARLGVAGSTCTDGDRPAGRRARGDQD